MRRVLCADDLDIKRTPIQGFVAEPERDFFVSFQAGGGMGDGLFFGVGGLISRARKLDVCFVFCA